MASVAGTGPHAATVQAVTAIRVAVVGVGNCASSLIQGVHYYRDAAPDEDVPGLMHVQFGNYHVSDITFVAAFDVDTKKVGLDLADAISASENNTITITEVPRTGVAVQRGPTLDGLGEFTGRRSQSRMLSPSTLSLPFEKLRLTSWSPTCQWVQSGRMRFMLNVR